MNKVDDKYQQQILFDTQIEDENKANALSTPNQIVFDNDDWQLDSSGSAEKLEYNIESLIEKKTKPRWLWRLIALLFFLLLLIESIDYFQVGFVETPITTTLVALLFTCLSFISMITGLKEYRGLKQYKKQKMIQMQAIMLLNGSDNDQEKMKSKAEQYNALALCEKITENLPNDLLFDEQGVWQEINKDELSEQEIMQLYSRTVLTKIDQNVISDIAKFSTESVVLIALSPVAIIDMMIMLWRNLRMIDKISGLYGLELGYWSRLKLIKQVFLNMVYAGASEMIADVGADMLGANILGKISGRFAQGLGAGMLTARLGLRVLKMARPIPYSNKVLSQDEPRIGQIRQAIINQVTTLIKNK